MLADISLNIKLPHALNSIIAHSNISISPGGKGYNIAHTLNLLNVPAILSTMYGKDDIGKFFARHLKNKNIEAPASNIVDGNSGIFVAVLNLILAYFKSNNFQK